jgi:hypothetical protein
VTNLTADLANLGTAGGAAAATAEAYANNTSVPLAGAGIVG